MQEIKIIIVDDDKEQITILKTFFSLQYEMKVVDIFPTGNMFLESYKFLNADVVIMDIGMPGKSGIECIREAKQQRPDWQFIISTTLVDYNFIFEAFGAGATGYICKSDKQEVLIEAIKNVMQGGSPMSAQIARLVVSSFRRESEKHEAKHNLSEREIEIVTFLSQGLNYKEISNKLFISPETVRTHIRNIYTKLQVRSKTDAINKVFPR